MTVSIGFDETSFGCQKMAVAIIMDGITDDALRAHKAYRECMDALKMFFRQLPGKVRRNLYKIYRQVRDKAYRKGLWHSAIAGFSNLLDKAIAAVSS